MVPIKCTLKTRENREKSLKITTFAANDRFLAIVAIFTSSLQPRFWDSTPDLP